VVLCVIMFDSYIFPFDTCVCFFGKPGRPLPRSDDVLMEHFNLCLNKDEIAAKIDSTKRVDEFVKWALEGVERLRQQMVKAGGVDFLMRLDLAAAVAADGDAIPEDAKNAPPINVHNEQPIVKSNVGGPNEWLPAGNDINTATAFPKPPPTLTTTTSGSASVFPTTPGRPHSTSGVGTTSPALVKTPASARSGK